MFLRSCYKMNSPYRIVGGIQYLQNDGLSRLGYRPKAYGCKYEGRERFPLSNDDSNKTVKRKKRNRKLDLLGDLTSETVLRTNVVEFLSLGEA